MLSYLMVDNEFGHRILVWIDGAALVIEILAVLLIIAPIFYAVGHYLFQAALHPEIEDLYRQLRVRLGKALLLGLEILVAADIAGAEFDRTPRPLDRGAGRHQHDSGQGQGERPGGTQFVKKRPDRPDAEPHRDEDPDAGARDRRRPIRSALVRAVEDTRHRLHRFRNGRKHYGHAQVS